MNAVAEKEDPRRNVAESNTVSMFERLAKDPSVTVEKLQGLMDLQERAMSRDAAQAFNAAMAAAQTEMRPVAADADNPQTKSRYASYAGLDRALRPIYTKHGFALSFDTGDNAPELHVRVLCHVSHVGGHSRTYHVDMPADGKGAKGGDVMTKTHAVGSAMSYGMRYLLKMIFNVAVGDHDDDGNGAGQKDFITDDQADTLDTLIENTKTNLPAFLKLFKISKLCYLPAGKYQEAVTFLNQRARS